MSGARANVSVSDPRRPASPDLVAPEPGVDRQRPRAAARGCADDGAKRGRPTRGGGFLVTRKVGRSRVVRANLSSPSVPPLTQLTIVTFGPQTVVAEEFASLGAARVVVFGSWAARYHGETGALPADIDVLVVGEGIDRADLYAAAERAEARLAMPVNPVLRPAGSWDAPGNDALLVQIESRPYVDVTRRPA